MNVIKIFKVIAVYFIVLTSFQGWLSPAKATAVSYDMIYGYQGNMAIFEKDGKQGAMNPRQEVIIPPIYDFVSLFEHGLARVLVDRKWGMIRDTGEIIIEPQYDYISEFLAESRCPAGYKQIARIILNEKMGFVGSDGYIISEPRFEIDRGWDEGYSEKGIYVLENGLRGILRTDRHMVAEPQYSYILAPVQGVEYTFVTDTNATNGMTVEEISTQRLYIEAQSLEENIVLLATVYKNTKWYRADAYGNPTQEIINLDDLNALPYFRKGVACLEFELEGLPEEEDPYVVVYMNPYGDLLRVLRNLQYYPEKDSSGELGAWDLWDLGL